MSFSIRATIRAFVAPDYRLSCPPRLWRAVLEELRRRGGGQAESGAFLLGQSSGSRRAIDGVAYYDDLDPDSLKTGIVVFDGRGYGPLWALCRETGRTVVADVHTHGGLARQSSLDRDNPMVATAGHVAIIVPSFAQGQVRIADLGIYEYEGAHRWRDLSGPRAGRYFYVGLWG
jgi:proteasome lid subunit RPN8/RPN11